MATLAVTGAPPVPQARRVSSSDLLIRLYGVIYVMADDPFLWETWPDGSELLAGQ